MPGILTACIFSAQRGDATMFYRNSRLLALLCLVSGISRLIFLLCIACILGVLTNLDNGLVLNDEFVFAVASEVAVLRWRM